MPGFRIDTGTHGIILFDLYYEEAPRTVEAFLTLLPFSRSFIHARVSGAEIWIDNAPRLDIIQENASVFARPGEIVLGPIHPARVRTAGCMGIFYGEGKGLDSSNIFGRVREEGFQRLKELGDKIWKEGAQELRFEQEK